MNPTRATLVATLVGTLASCAQPDGGAGAPPSDAVRAARAEVIAALGEPAPAARIKVVGPWLIALTQPVVDNQARFVLRAWPVGNDERAATPVTITDGTATVLGFDADERGFYWVESTDADSRVMGAELDGSNPRALHTEPNVHDARVAALAVARTDDAFDAGFVYFVRNSWWDSTRYRSAIWRVDHLGRAAAAQMFVNTAWPQVTVHEYREDVTYPEPAERLVVELTATRLGLAWSETTGASYRSGSTRSDPLLNIWTRPYGVDADSTAIATAQLVYELAAGDARVVWRGMSTPRPSVCVVGCDDAIAPELSYVRALAFGATGDWVDLTSPSRQAPQVDGVAGERYAAVAAGGDLVCWAVEDPGFSPVALRCERGEQGAGRIVATESPPTRVVAAATDGARLYWVTDAGEIKRVAVP